MFCRLCLAYYIFPEDILYYSVIHTTECNCSFVNFLEFCENSAQ